MKDNRPRRLWQDGVTVLWALLLLSLPVTSFPLLAEVSGASTVAPLAGIPLAALILVWLVPHLLGRGTLPRLMLPLLGFAIAALIAAAAAFLIDVPPYKGNRVLSQEISALITLAIGGAFYVLAAAWPRDDRRLQFTLRWINYSGLVLLLWSLGQAVVTVFLDGRFPPWIETFQDWISLRGVFAVRVSGFPRLIGFAYEPSWLAHQLNVLYLPFWLGATLARHSSHRFRMGPLIVEHLLLAGGGLVVVLSFSRVGILALMLVVTALIFRSNLRLVGRLTDRLLQRMSAGPGVRGAARAGITGLLIGLSLLAYLALILGLVYTMGRYDRRMAALFDPGTYLQGNFYAVTNQLAFAERVVYWGTGWEIFNDHPAVGVGPGNAGFFFVEEMPAFGWGLYETGRIFFRRSFLPNTKSMWVRILSETGLLGMAFFATWYYLLWRAARLLEGTRNPGLRAVALAGQFTLLAFLVEGFSIDSFALPYLWVSLGLLTAAVSLVTRRQPTVPPDHPPATDTVAQTRP